MSKQTQIAAHEAAIENATKQIASAKTIEEAQQWQGIVNQQIQALKDLGLDGSSS